MAVSQHNGQQVISLWSFAIPTAGILNTTTAVTLKAAVAGQRAYLSQMYISSEALGAATEIVIRDGAGGTVLWRDKIGTAGRTNGQNINFVNGQLFSSPGNLLEFATLTASVTGAVYVNATGYMGL